MPCNIYGTAHTRGTYSIVQYISMRRSGAKTAHTNGTAYPRGTYASAHTKQKRRAICGDGGTYNTYTRVRWRRAGGL